MKKPHQEAELIARDYVCKECFSWLRLYPLYRDNNGELITKIVCSKDEAHRGIIHKAKAREIEDKRNWDRLNKLYEGILGEINEKSND